MLKYLLRCLGRGRRKKLLSPSSAEAKESEMHQYNADSPRYMSLGRVNSYRPRLVANLDGEAAHTLMTVTPFDSSLAIFRDTAEEAESVTSCEGVMDGTEHGKGDSLDTGCGGHVDDSSGNNDIAASNSSATDATTSTDITATCASGENIHAGQKTPRPFPPELILDMIDLLRDIRKKQCYCTHRCNCPSSKVAAFESLKQLCYFSHPVRDKIQPELFRDVYFTECTRLRDYENMKFKALGRPGGVGQHIRKLTLHAKMLCTVDNAGCHLFVYDKDFPQHRWLRKQCEEYAAPYTQRVDSVLGACCSNLEELHAVAVDYHYDDGFETCRRRFVEEWFLSAVLKALSTYEFPKLKRAFFKVQSNNQIWEIFNMFIEDVSEVQKQRFIRNLSWVDTFEIHVSSILGICGGCSTAIGRVSNTFFGNFKLRFGNWENADIWHFDTHQLAHAWSLRSLTIENTHISGRLCRLLRHLPYLEALEMSQVELKPYNRWHLAFDACSRLTRLSSVLFRWNFYSGCEQKCKKDDECRVWRDRKEWLFGGRYDRALCTSWKEDVDAFDGLMRVIKRREVAMFGGRKEEEEYDDGDGNGKMWKVCYHNGMEENCWPIRKWDKDGNEIFSYAPRSPPPGNG